MTPYIQLENIDKSFGDLELYTNINLTIAQGDRSALIAKNGAGKTTLFNIISGKESPDKGRVTFTKGVTYGILEQDPIFDEKLNVLEAVFYSNSPLSVCVKNYEKALKSNDTDLIIKASEQMDFLQAWNIESKAKTILSQLKVDDLSQSISTLSGGQRKRLALAILLIDDTDILILDEPTNHLDIEMAQWLEEFLQKSNKTILMITHDRCFLDRVCNKIYEIDQKVLYTYQGNYTEFMIKREERIAQFNAQRDKAQNLYYKELEWMRRMPQARGTKQKYRQDAFWETKKSAFKSRDDNKIRINSENSRLGTKIFVANGISKKFDNKIILDKFSYTYSRFERMGIIGKNGSGKSTFLNILTGKVPIDSGVLELGETVRFGYYRQHTDSFDNSKRVIDIITDIAEVVKSAGSNVTASALLTQFLFTPERQYGMVGALSGGEKRRLYLLSILIQSPNFLILDEPTNDLDIVTLGVLEEWLENFEGCVLVVSHDRFFMDKVVDKLMVFKGDGEIGFFEGNYTEYCNDIYDKKQTEQALLKLKEVDKIKPINKVISNKPKLSYKEKQEFELLEEEMEELESEKAEIEKTMNSGNISTEEIAKLSTKYQQAINTIDEKSFRWLELSEKA